ncbi:MAG: hypothetical protein AAGA59_05885 [Actinomycetota bacterium]
MLPRTSFIGRARESASIESQVRAGPLVTLTGAGGIGKTRLALEVAEGLRSDALDGIVVVELAALPAASPPAAVEERFLAALAWPTMDAVLDWAATATALLVVDNCEHVIDAAAVVVERLLTAGPELRLLATSRLPLAVPGEQVVVVEPLATADAVALLRERATSAGARLGADDDALDRLCRRLDGLPLALELAATRLRALSPAEVEEGLASSGRLLQQSRPTGGRHAGMDEAIAWSYELLEPELQALFRGLAVFPGRFGLDDVVAVLGADDTSRLDLADQLDRLVAHSLVVVVVGAGRRRHRLLVPVRQLALHWLTETGGFTALEQRLIDHLVASANTITLSGLQGAWTEEVMDNAFDLTPDLRATARRCIAIDDDPARAFALFIPNWAIVHHRDVLAVARVGDELLARWPEPGPLFWPEIAAIGATAHLGLGAFDRVRTLADAALDASAGPSVASVVALRALSLVAAVEGDFEAAYRQATEGSTLAGDLGLDAFRVELDSHRGGFLSEAGRRDEAEALLLRVLEESRETGSLLVELATLQLLAEHHLDDRQRCERYLAAIDERLEPGSIVDTSWARQITAGRLAIETGEVASAVTAFGEALRLARSAGDRRDAWRAIRGLGIVAALMADEHELAARLLAAADAEPVAPAPTATARAQLEEARAAVAHLDVEPAANAARLALTFADSHLAPVPGDERHHPAPAGDEAAPGVAAPSFTVAAGSVRIEWRGERCELRPMKGLTDLARLLAAPGREIHVLELMGATFVERDTGPVLDAEARRRYEERLRHLQQDIHDAEDDNDLGRLGRAQDEFDAIVAALEESLGLGGRDRRPGAAAEKARQAVAWRVRAAIKRVEGELPACGRHLRAAVKTGAFCRYEPEYDPGWEVKGP